MHRFQVPDFHNGGLSETTRVRCLTVKLDETAFGGHMVAILKLEALCCELILISGNDPDGNRKGFCFLLAIGTFVSQVFKFPGPPNNDTSIVIVIIVRAKKPFPVTCFIRTMKLYFWQTNAEPMLLPPRACGQHNNVRRDFTALAGGHAL
jgi:hypothetical protein